MCFFGEQLPMPIVMFSKPPDVVFKDPAGKSFVMSLAHNLRNMRKALLKMDAVVNPECASKTYLHLEYQMVYVKIMPKGRVLTPRYVGPAMVTGVNGRVLTIKWLKTGKVERVNVKRVKPVHKIRDEYAGITFPEPLRTTKLIE